MLFTFASCWSSKTISSIMFLENSFLISAMFFLYFYLSSLLF
jgi:hypothetical protein